MVSLSSTCCPRDDVSAWATLACTLLCAVTPGHLKPPFNVIARSQAGFDETWCVAEHQSMHTCSKTQHSQALVFLSV